ncbi:MAG: diadenylate cyclase [Rickettsiales bacterium]|jgi:diadenylate cyclase|nr:diadenylate cyclase [Rickettsiales bacterium]
MEFFIHNLVDVFQLVIITIIIWLFYRRFIKNTNAEKLVRGLVGLGIIWLVSMLLFWAQLRLLGGFTMLIATFLSVAVVVVFQPELRKFFALMGHIKFLRALFTQNSVKNTEEMDATEAALDQIILATEFMSKKHTGALMVFRYDFDGTIANTGVKIDATISSELILTIFFNKTPLHDGAMILGNNRILNAGAILPLTKNTNLGWKYGTRHRAAIGMSEESNALVLVVSEESGDISVVEHGKITKYDDMKKLRARLKREIIETNI